MNLLPKATTDFSESDYWNSFFKKRGKKAFEWYGEYPELCGILHKYIRTRDKILVIGCGNSSLSSDLYDVGYKQITNIDVSGVVIKQMQDRSRKKPGLEYLKMDATQTSFKDGEFTVVLDKGTLDALMPDSSAETLDRTGKLFNEIDRVLSPLGRYVCVSLLQPHILHTILTFCSVRGWMLRVCRCEDAEQKTQDGGVSFPVFVLICTKLKKMPQSKPVLEVCLTEESVQRMSSVEDVMEAVKATQEMALVCAGLSRSSLAGSGEVSVELNRPGDPNPRYILIVADSPNARGSGSMKFAAFIVPKGREREWLFGTPEGRQTLVANSGFDRLVLIHLQRGHEYESLQATQDETADLVLKFAPNLRGEGPGPKIPFLSVGSDLGNVTEVARGKSDFTGEFVIEDVEGANKQLYRRLIFLDNQNVVQSEARLKTISENGGSQKLVDVCYLACEHHSYMTLGVSMVAAEDENTDVLVIGLGGGGLCSYVCKCFSNVKMTAVDIDPVVLEVATKYFSLNEDDHLQVVIEDGLSYIKNAVKTGQKFTAILFDVDSKDSSVGLSCPPSSFLEPDVISAVAACLTNSGVFILNFVCRVSELRAKTVAKLKKSFVNITSIKLEQEVNEIFFCTKRKKPTALLEAVDKLNKIVKLKQIQENDLISKQDILSLVKNE